MTLNETVEDDARDARENRALEVLKALGIPEGVWDGAIEHIESGSLGEYTDNSLESADAAALNGDK